MSAALTGRPWSPVSVSQATDAHLSLLPGVRHTLALLPTAWEGRSGSEGAWSPAEGTDLLSACPWAGQRASPGSREARPPPQSSRAGNRFPRVTVPSSAPHLSRNRHQRSVLHRPVLPSRRLEEQGQWVQRGRGWSLLPPPLPLPLPGQDAAQSPLVWAWSPGALT